MRALHRTRSPIPIVAIALSTMLLATGCDVGVVDPEATTPPTTGSQPSGPPATAEPEQAVSDQGSGAMLLVMDASGSMNETDASGEILLDGAKQALRGVVEALPDGTQVGLRVYGHRVPNTDQENGCQDTELIHPVAPLDRPALLAAIDGFDAVGYTPIGLSLREAAADLPPEGPRSIILVSDGEDTCAPPEPCDVAAEISGEGIDLVVHTVGFALGDNDAARSELECIAEAGGGEFHDAADGAELASTLTDVSGREARRYQTTGAALVGAPVPGQADTGQVGAAHTDVVLGTEVNFYRFEVAPGTQVQGEMIMVGIPGESSLICPLLYLTDRLDVTLASPVDFAGGSASKTFIKGTEPVVVNDDEVYAKVVTEGCSGADLSGLEFDVELKVAALS